MTSTQALRERIQTAQLAARQNGRPFSSVLDLLGNPDDEAEVEGGILTPEEQLVRDLVNLAVTIRDGGQVNWRVIMWPHDDSQEQMLGYLDAVRTEIKRARALPPPTA